MPRMNQKDRLSGTPRARTFAPLTYKPRKSLKKKEFTRDLIIGHFGWGETWDS